MFLRLPLLCARFLHNGRLRLVFLMLLMGLIIISIVLYYGMRQTDAQLCFMLQEPSSESPQSHRQTIDANGDADAPKLLGDVLLTKPIPVPGRSIFFHETRCHLPKRRRQRPGQSPEMQYNMLQLTARQACAIESAALHNPNFQVFVLFASPTYRHHGNGSQQRTQPLIDAILSYKNVQLRQLNLWRYAQGTPIEGWLKDGQLFRSR